MSWFWFLCLTAAAMGDIKERIVSDRLLIACGVMGAVCGWQSGIWTHWAGGLAGAAVLLVSRLTQGAIGKGDGWFIIASAGYLDTEEMWVLLLGSFGISWVWSVGLVMYRTWTGGRISKDTLPFLACMWPVGAWIMLFSYA